MTDLNTSFAANLKAFVSRRRWLLISLPFIAVLYAFYIDDLATNPRGFYLDESAGSYNAYLIATTGQSEFGDLPLYPKYYTESATEQGNPTHLYMLAAMYLFVPPSTVSARILAATTVFIATLLLGVLAVRLSGRRTIGVIVALTAMGTPWFFDASRLVLEVFTYPLVVVLFLLCLHSAQKREKWTLSDNALLAATLALITYSYSIGRLLGPALAFGLIIFAVNKKGLLNVLRTWVGYGITLIPLAVFYFNKPGNVTGRFVRVTYISFDKTLMQNWQEFWPAYWADISPDFLLYVGDPLLRHHIPGMGGILAATFVLAVIGLILALGRCLREPWWRFIVFGLLVSALPGALTVQRYHALRLIAFPVFLMVLTVPALAWLLGKRRERSTETDGAPAGPKPGYGHLSRWAGRAVLCLVLILTFYQAYNYQTRFREMGPNRGYVFDDAYPAILNDALASQSRPIYLKDGRWGPAYIHAYWYATIQGVDLSAFVHLAEREVPPAGSIVISSDENCTKCEMISKRGPYILYKALP